MAQDIYFKFSRGTKTLVTHHDFSSIDTIISRNIGSVYRFIDYSYLCEIVEGAVKIKAKNEVER